MFVGALVLSVVGAGVGVQANVFGGLFLTTPQKNAIDKRWPIPEVEPTWVGPLPTSDSFGPPVGNFTPEDVAVLAPNGVEAWDSVDSDTGGSGQLQYESDIVIGQETVLCGDQHFSGGTRCPETVGAIWAGGRASTGSSPDIKLTGATITIIGSVHSESSLAVSGAGSTVSGPISAVAPNVVTGVAGAVPAAQLIQPGGIPDIKRIDAYRYLQSNQKLEIPKSLCTNEVWSPNLNSLVDGKIYWTECSVRVNGSGVSKRLTIASEKNIVVSGVGLDLLPAQTGLGVLVAGRHVTVSGSTMSIGGPTVGEFGVDVSATGSSFCQLVTANIVSVAGSQVTVKAVCP